MAESQRCCSSCPRDGRSAPRFIELPAFFQFHFANGFERDNTLTIDLARYPDYVAIGEVLRTYWRSPWTTKDMARLVRLTVDLATGKFATRDYPSGSTNEFPRIHPGFVGRPYRYVWIACNAAACPEGLHQQIARVDVETGKVITHDFGPDRYNGEPVFVPTGTSGEEDDGVVLATLFDARRKSSILVGLDGRDPAAHPLFTAPLDAALPFALHDFFSAGCVTAVPDRELWNSKGSRTHGKPSSRFCLFSHGRIPACGRGLANARPGPAAGDGTRAGRRRSL